MALVGVRSNDFFWRRSRAIRWYGKLTWHFSLQVSWVRHRDIHLLTVGRYTYTSDQRFEALHLPHAEEWTLRIRYPQRKDSGIYECQISTTPPIGHPVYLTIVGKFDDDTLLILVITQGKREEKEKKFCVFFSLTSYWRTRFVNRTIFFHFTWNDRKM